MTKYSIHNLPIINYLLLLVSLSTVFYHVWEHLVILEALYFQDCRFTTEHSCNSHLASISIHCHQIHHLQIHLWIYFITVSQVYLQTHSVMTSNCISQLTQLLLWSSYLRLLNHGLQGHPIIASQSLSTLSQSWPASTTPSSPNNSLWVYF